jgi:hypothetical protein
MAPELNVLMARAYAENSVARRPWLSQTALFPTNNAQQKGRPMTLNRLLTAAALVGIVSGTALAQSPNPLVGTWKLNPAKSKGSMFKSGSTNVEAAGTGVKFSVELVPADGTPTRWSFTANYDGKDNPVTGNSPYGDTVALTRVDAKTTRITVKQGGKVTVTQTIVVADDGKTRTTTTKGTNAKGEPVDAVALYEKQ